MLVFGSRMYFKKNVVKSHGECEHCGRYAKHLNYQARKFGHLYFIPIIPVGPRSQVLNECSKCNMGSHVPMDTAEAIVESLNGQFKEWIIQIQEGQTEVVPEDGAEPVNIGLMIAGTVESLYCLGEIKDVDAIAQILDASDLPFEKSIVLGRWNEVQGELANAVQHYQSAAATGSVGGVAWSLMGKAESLRGNVAGAEQAYGKYLQQNPDDLGTYLELAGLAERGKDYSKTVQIYDKLYSLEPSLLQQKPMKKVYKKACKKSGETGQFLNQL